MTLHIMSDKELAWLEVLRDLTSGRLTAFAALELFAFKRYRLQGAGGMISLKRGQPSNRKTPYDLRVAVMAVVRSNYADFGPQSKYTHSLHGTLNDWYGITPCLGEP